MLDDGAIAVRPGDQFAAGQVPGAVNIALSGQFASWAGTILGLSARPVLISETAEQLSEAPLNVRLAVHCQSGYRSMIACSLLQRAGFQNVINVTGGFDAWQKAQLPVSTGAPVET